MSNETNLNYYLIKAYFFENRIQISFIISEVYRSKLIKISNK